MRALPLLLTSLAIACSKPSPPTLAPESAMVTSVDAQGVHLTVTMTATNPNSVDVPVKDFTAHVVIADKMNLGTMTVDQAVKLSAGKATKIDVPLVLPWTDVPELAQMATKPAPVPFTVDGNAELGGDMLHVSVPYTIKGTMTQAQLLGAAARSLPQNVLR